MRFWQCGQLSPWALPIISPPRVFDHGTALDLAAAQGPMSAVCESRLEKPPSAMIERYGVSIESVRPPPARKRFARKFLARRRRFTIASCRASPPAQGPARWSKSRPGQGDAYQLKALLSSGLAQLDVSSWTDDPAPGY